MKGGRYMVRVVLLAIATALLAPATTVQGTIYMPDNTLASGRAYIDLSGTCIGPGGKVVLPPTKIVTFTSGVFSVVLEPNDTCTPATAYRVRYQIAGWNAPVEFWNVPNSGSPVTIASVRVASVPSGLASVAMSLLTGGVSKGDLVAYTGTSFIRVPAGTVGQVLKRDDGASSGVSWQADSSGTLIGRYSATISPSSTTWTVTGATHALNGCPTVVQAWIGDAVTEDFATVACNPSTYDVTVTFNTGQTGDIYISTDPAFLSPLFTQSLVSSVVAESFTAASSVTVTHNLNAVVMARCFDSNGQKIGFGAGTRLSANALTINFAGAPSGFCIAAR